MIPAPSTPDQPLSQQEIEAMIDRATIAWGDAFNQNLTLTVRALQRLHVAFDDKFIRTNPLPP